MRVAKTASSAPANVKFEGRNIDFGHLSSREAQVLSLAAAGYIDKQIGQKLGVSVNTLRTYWNRIRSKIGEVPRSALSAQYVTYIASQERERQSIDDRADYEVDLTTGIFSVPSTEPHPHQHFHGWPVQDVIASADEDERDRRTQLMADIESGKVDNFIFRGRFTAPSGPFTATSLVRVDRDADGKPVRVRGTRLEMYDMVGGATSSHDWELDFATGTVTRVSDTVLSHPMEKNQSVPVEWIISNYHPDDQPKVRALVACARKGQLDSFTFYGRVITEEGVEPSGGYVTLVRDSQGIPIKALGTRSVLFSMGGDRDPVVVGRAVRELPGGKLSADDPLKKAIGAKDNSDLLAAIVRAIVDEEQDAFRESMILALSGPRQIESASYRLNDGNWVRVESFRESHEGRERISIRFIFFK